MFTNVGVPQGDGISPLLFVTYPFHANQKLKEGLSVEVEDSSYADDQIFYSREETLVGEVKAKVKDVYQEFYPTVSEEKTEDFRTGEPVESLGRGLTQKKRGRRE